MTAPVLLDEPTPEMLRWANRLRPILRRDSVLGIALVTPVAHFANRSVGFQAYLYDVFHRSIVARVGHLLLMPFIIATVMAVLASIWWPLAPIAAAALGTWYVYVGRLNDMLAVGIVSTGLLALLTAAGMLYVQAGPIDRAPPFLLLIVGSFGQMLSHVAEPHVPPRVSGTNHWVPLTDFFRQAPLRNLLRASFMFLAGTINELWASPRLLPILVLNSLWRVGYQPEARREHQKVVEQAIADNDPAIDCIGHGGAGAHYA